MPALNAAVLLTVWEEASAQTPICRALHLLAAARPQKSFDEWAAMTIGQRDSALLALHEQLFGSTLEVTTRWSLIR